MNNNNNPKDNEMECEVHEENTYEFICCTCKVGMCKLCIISKEHRGHETSLINKETMGPLIQEFNNADFKSLNRYSEKIKEYLQISNTEFDKIEKEHTNNINLVTNEFKQINTILNRIENDRIKHLLTILDKNNDLKNNISTIANKNLKNIEKIKNKYQNAKNFEFGSSKINNLVFLKQCHQVKLFLKENSDGSTILGQIEKYNHIRIQQSFETFKDSIKDVFKIYDEFQDPINVRVDGVNFSIYKEGGPENYYETKYALGPSIKNLKVGSIPHNVIKLILLDGFNFQLSQNILPSSISTLYVGAIKQPLLAGSIPSGVSSLFLLDGFNQKIVELPRYIQHVYVGDIKDTVLPNNQSYTIYKSPSCKTQFRHQFNSCISSWSGCQVIMEMENQE
ncbi:hypothetical protein ACTA71_003279 [Dictyostelium dimigraforme]